MKMSKIDPKEWDNDREDRKRNKREKKRKQQNENKRKKEKKGKKETKERDGTHEHTPTPLCGFFVGAVGGIIN